MGEKREKGKGEGKLRQLGWRRRLEGLVDSPIECRGSRETDGTDGTTAADWRPATGAPPNEGSAIHQLGVGVVADEHHPGNGDEGPDDRERERAGMDADTDDEDAESDRYQSDAVPDRRAA